MASEATTENKEETTVEAQEPPAKKQKLEDVEVKETDTAEAPKAATKLQRQLFSCPHPVLQHGSLSRRTSPLSYLQSH